MDDLHQCWNQWPWLKVRRQRWTIGHPLGGSGEQQDNNPWLAISDLFDLDSIVFVDKIDDNDRCNVSIDLLLRSNEVSSLVHSGISVNVSDFCDNPLTAVSQTKWNDCKLESLSRKLRYVDDRDFTWAAGSCFFGLCLELFNTSMTETRESTHNIQLLWIANRDWGFSTTF